MTTRQILKEALKDYEFAYNYLDKNKNLFTIEVVFKYLNSLRLDHGLCNW